MSVCTSWILTQCHVYNSKTRASLEDIRGDRHQRRGQMHKSLGFESPPDMPTRTANQKRVSQAGGYCKQSFHFSTPVSNSTDKPAHHRKGRINKWQRQYAKRGCRDSAYTVLGKQLLTYSAHGQGKEEDRWHHTHCGGRPPSLPLQQPHGV